MPAINGIGINPPADIVLVIAFSATLDFVNKRAEQQSFPVPSTSLSTENLCFPFVAHEAWNSVAGKFWTFIKALVADIDQFVANFMSQSPGSLNGHQSTNF